MGVFPLMREREVAQRQSAGSQVLPVYLQRVFIVAWGCVKNM